jgi:hypothetical protein
MDLEQFQHGRIVWSPATGALLGSPTVQLQDNGTQILVAGNGFTPNSQVKIFYSYDDKDGFHTNGADNPLIRSTDTNGSFQGAPFDLNGVPPFTHINAKAVDDVTNQEAVASLR